MRIIWFCVHNREALLDMMSTIKRFLKERKLTLCTEKKIKILMFNRRDRQMEMEDKYIEKMKSVKYLGFV